MSIASFTTRLSLIRYASATLILSLVLLLMPLGSLAGIQIQSPVKTTRFAASNSVENLSALSMVRGLPNTRGMGRGDLLVTSGHKFLTVFLTDLEGESKSSAAVHLSLLGPGGKPVRASKLPTINPLMSARLNAYQAQIKKSAGIAGLKDPEQVFDKLQKAQSAKPMDAELQRELLRTASRIKSTPNLVMIVPHKLSQNPDMIVVLNPTPGNWKLNVSGGDRGGFYACLAAGESHKSLAESQELWPKAIQGFSKPEDQPHGPAVFSLADSALASKLSCTVCRTIVNFAVYYYATLVLFLLVGMIAASYGTDTFLAMLIASAVIAALEAGIEIGIGRYVCRHIGFCK